MQPAHMDFRRVIRISGGLYTGGKPHEGVIYGGLWQQIPFATAP